MLELTIKGASKKDLIEFMKAKVSATQQLEAALAERESLNQALVEIDNRIEQLTKDALV